MTLADVSVTLDPVYARLLNRQREFQDAMGLVPSKMTAAERQDYIRTMVLALKQEAGEALEETHWKPWATPPAGASIIVNRQRYLGELADTFIFLMNLMLVGGISSMEFAQAVDAKITKNIKRQADGYDGKSSKCPRCGRAYDDDAVMCRKTPPGASAYGYCESIHDWIDQNGQIFP